MKILLTSKLRAQPQRTSMELFFFGPEQLIADVKVLRQEYITLKQRSVKLAGVGCLIVTTVAIAAVYQPSPLQARCSK